MVSLAKKKRDIADMLGSGAVAALQLAVPLAKTIPLVGNTVEGSLEAVLHIIPIKDGGHIPGSGNLCRRDHSPAASVFRRYHSIHDKSTISRTFAVNDLPTCNEFPSTLGTAA